MVCLLHLVLALLLDVAASADPNLCLDGSNLVECFVEPCMFAECNNHAEAVCEDDYCGGCFARFYVNATEVTDDCREVDQPFLCVDGSRPVQCLLAPCSVDRCDNHPDAICEDDYCGGCFSRFYVNATEVTSDCREVDQPFLCVDGSRPVQCLLAPCSVNRCDNHPDAICENDYCGGCNAKFYLNGTEVTEDCSVTVIERELCTELSSPVIHCAETPCSLKRCDKHTEATCVNDYCTGCHARFYVNNTEVTDDCHLVDQPLFCADGSWPVQCYVEPCSGKSCAKHPDAICEDDYCGGCNTKFYLHGNEVTGDCAVTDQPFLCVDGSRPVQCLLAPCSVTSCDKYPDAICENDYCGGCNAKFYLHEEEVTDYCTIDNQPYQCTDGSSPVNCFVPPCDVTYCGKHPDAICVDDYCGGCNARFYANDKEVTDDCRDDVVG